MDVFLLPDATRGVEAVHLRHLDVHEHDNGAQSRRDGDRLLAVARLADDLEIILSLEDRSQPGSHT